ncbi:tubulin binding cofactor A [Gamsiella multidivaricata]|uniref:tubulin binding cofactor A n=1 Tax=Gamsiella multidivaricata TaxID=101098 RepID=UPI0022203FC3|nr:tubulin binding cofactor A [Gamsiella multidivaricata]KAG0360962.1 hypothetical protein BGZ54_009312 [Gamsiella multidivaricata]KAI7817211.1 tubulin binding cofactor A [Gamsiella multidivaricata]
MSTRDLSIKTNVLKRLAKERIFYNEEKMRQQKRIDAMVAKDPEDYEIKKQREVLEETLDMLPDVERRSKAAHQDLANVVTKASPDVKSSKEYEEAVQALETYEVN